MAGTGKPVGSTDFQDAEVNLENFDKILNSDQDTVFLRETPTNPGGKLQKTISGIISEGEDAIQALRIESPFTFSQGGTLTAPNQIVLYETNGRWYRWDGSYNKVVAPGTNPTLDPLWVDVGQANLRTELLDKYGVLLVGNGMLYAETVEDLYQSIPEIDLSDGVTAYVRGVGPYYFDPSISEWVKDFDETPYYQYTQMGQAFDTKALDAPVTDNFAGWVHETVDFNPTEGKFIVFYNINSGHSISTNRVLLTKKRVDAEEFETPTIVADSAPTESCKTQAAGIAANGDYVVLVGVFPWGSNSSSRTDIYRSSDFGATWSVTTMKDSADDSNIVAFNGDVSGFLKLKSGRLLTFAVEPAPSYLTRIYYSDDHGATWSKSSIAGNPTDVTEPAWCELPDGTIVCMARAAVRSGSTNSIIPAKFMLSHDSGLTWTAPVDSQSITDFTLSNGKMIVNEDDGYVEFIHHSRHTKPDGYSSLLVSRASFDNAKADKFSQQVRIGKLAAYIPYEDSTGDSGYVGAAKSPNGVINVFYYNGKRNGAQINWAIGKKTNKEQREYFINPFTGEKNTGDNAAWFESLIYDGKLESYSLATPLVNGYMFSSGEAQKNEGSYLLNLDGVGRASCMPVKGVNLTDVNTLFVSVSGESMDVGVDFGIALYNKKNPTSVTDGRLKIKAERFNGQKVIEMDVTEYNGIYYPMLMLSNNHTAGSAGQVRVQQFGFTSNSKKYGDLTYPGVNHSLYYRGNENNFLSAGWNTAYTQGGGTVTKNPDVITLVADGSTAVSRAVAMTGKTIALSNRNLVEIIAQVEISDSSKSDFGVALFSKNNPTGPTDGRVAFNYIKQTGILKAYLDVSGITDPAYIAIVATANSDGSAPSIVTVRVFDVRMY